MKSFFYSRISAFLLVHIMMNMSKINDLVLYQNECVFQVGDYRLNLTDGSRVNRKKQAFAYGNKNIKQLKYFHDFTDRKSAPWIS